MKTWLGMLVLAAQIQNLLASVYFSPCEWTMPDFQATDPEVPEDAPSPFQEETCYPTNRSETFEPWATLQPISTVSKKASLIKKPPLRQCPYPACGLILASNQSVAGHLKSRIHEVQINYNDAKEIVCACSATFAQYSDFVSHFSLHPWCAKKLLPEKAQKEGRLSEKSAHSLKISRCPVTDCRFGALSKKILGNHKSTKHPVNPPRDSQGNILCPCGRAFAQENWKHFTKHLLQSWKCEKSIMNKESYNTPLPPLSGLPCAQISHAPHKTVPRYDDCPLQGLQEGEIMQSSSL